MGTLGTLEAVDNAPPLSGLQAAAHATRWLAASRRALRLAPIAFGLALSLYLAIDDLIQRTAVGRFSEDFDPSFWEPWHALRSGTNPYPNPANPLVHGAPFLYPPISAELTLPLSWLPYPLAAGLFVAVLLGAGALTLWALDVHSPELIALWMCCAAVIGAAFAGQATLVVILCTALVWRWRDSPNRAALALTAALCIKLFVWPVLFWLLLTRRYRAGIYSASASLLLIVGSWAVIGFDGFVDYPTLLASASHELGGMGVLAYAFAVKHTGDTVAITATLFVAAVLMLGVFVCRRDDRSSFTLTVLATLYATPILWLHYFGLLIIPVVLYGGWMWSAIPLLWLIRLADSGHSRPAWMIACFAALTAVFAVRAVADRAAKADSPADSLGSAPSASHKPQAVPLADL